LSAQAPLGDVSDTARWVAYFRGLESERPDALFHDAYALRLAGERGRTIANRLPKGALSWSVAVRTRIFDDMILDAVLNEGIGVVLNLAAGLDARPYRLPLPAHLRWIEVDLDELIARKSAALEGDRSACALERVSLDLTDRASRQELFARVKAETADARDPRVLVLTEGLLVYLDECDVASLADDLHRFFPTGAWLLENVSPSVLARQRKMWNKTLGPVNAEHKFAPERGLDFYRPHGWVPRETRSLLDEAQRLRREMRVVTWIRRVEALFPSLKGIYARRQAKFRDALVCARMEGP
jgi:methyltransferase (TIGR00027 family)